MVERKKKVEELRQTYLSWSLHDHDVRREGIREGMEKGMEKSKVESARKLLSMNLGTHEQIAQAVGLTLDKVKELAASINP